MISIEQININLASWFNRKTIKLSVRRVGELPICIGSDKGMVREENQDRVGVIRIPTSKNNYLTVLALCDGMGGMKDGSICASQSIASFFGACIEYRKSPLSEIANLAVQKANKEVFLAHNENGGATLSAVLIDSREGMIGVNVGDSRIYSFTNPHLQKMSTDDTLEDTFKKPGKDLLQFIGMKCEIEPHLLEFNKQPDFLLITSDGVHYIEDITIQKLLKNAKDYTTAAKRLITVSASYFGGHDNASLLIATNLSPNQMPTNITADSIQVWDPFGELTLLFPKPISSKKKVAGKRRKSTKTNTQQENVTPTKAKTTKNKKENTLPKSKDQQMTISYGDDGKNV